MLQDIELITETKKGTLIKVPAIIERKDGRIFFMKSPFALKDEIKSMEGSRWHGRLPDDGRKIWSVADSIRNNFQLSFMQGGNPYENWDKPLQNYGYSRPLYDHQKLMADGGLTYHYQFWAAEMGTGKTLSAIEVMEKSGVDDWWWVGPKSGIVAVEREFEKWGLRIQPKMMTYDRLRIDIEQWKDGFPAPAGVIFDESSRLKTPTAKRTRAAMHLADAIRKEYGWDGYCILMSGTPAPKSPVDWWSQCEVCYPGFLKEGTAKAFEWRLGIFQQKMTDAGKFWKLQSFRDDEKKCDICGEYEDHECHIMDEDAVLFGGGEGNHEYRPSKNEVLYLSERLSGLVTVLKKKDVLDLPEMIYREVILEPTSTIKRVGRALAKSAVSAIQGLTWLRELSDGFQYRQRQEGEKKCPVCKGVGECEQWSTDAQTAEPVKVMGTCEKCDGEGRVPNMVTDTKEIKTPKDQAVRDLLDENEEQGRIVFFAAFHGSVDRIIKLCHKMKWDVCKVDGRGWKVLPYGDEKVPPKTKTMDFWADMSNERVAFVAHPGSGGMALTLTEARMAVFYSNDHTPESRTQAEGRIHRPGMDENKGATIVDLFHLGTDRKTLNILKDNRRLEDMSLGEFQEMISDV